MLLSVVASAAVRVLALRLMLIASSPFGDSLLQKFKAPFVLSVRCGFVPSRVSLFQYGLILNGGAYFQRGMSLRAEVCKRNLRSFVIICY